MPTLAGWRPVIAGSGTARQRAGLTAAVSDHTPAWLKRQHFLYFLPLPHGHGSLRPALALRAGRGGTGAPIAATAPPASRGTAPSSATTRRSVASRAPASRSTLNGRLRSASPPPMPAARPPA